MNNNRFANGSVIYTENGYFAARVCPAHGWRYGGHQCWYSSSAGGILDSPGTTVVLRRTFTAWGATASSSTPRPRMYFHLVYRHEDSRQVDTWDGTMTRGSLRNMIQG